MPTQKKSSKSSGKKPQVKVRDMKPSKDTKGGRGPTWRGQRNEN